MGIYWLFFRHTDGVSTAEEEKVLRKKYGEAA